ncbi:MAG: cyclic nucleotide-binding domain-containing protein [Verrucomicrobiota bacterium JB022]|nr:cyclic nucleotide-binding domain-containing protein [Verrucomicrobiota bacterium JB022]
MQQEIEVSPGQTIIQQGEEGIGFFILKSGTLEVYKDDVLLAMLMYPGTVFGEMGGILGRPRTCTIRAKTQVSIIHVQMETVEELVHEQPEIAIKIIKTLANRLDRTTQKLIDTALENPVWAAR